MKRRRKSIDYGKERERRGDIFTPCVVTGLPAWMDDRSLLPKSPPKRSNPKPERSRVR